MNTKEQLWNDATAYEVLRRHAREDLHAGVYESYYVAMRGIRTFAVRAAQDENGRAAANNNYRLAMQDENPLVPIFSSETETSPAQLNLYQVKADNGLAVPASRLLVARTIKGEDLTPGSYFTDDQVKQLMDHVVDLHDNDLFPRLPEAD